MPEPLGVRIVYHSDYGNTEKMAEAVASGVKTADSDVIVHMSRASDSEPGDLVTADVVLFGTPVHMGGIAWQMKRFIDRCAPLWMEGALEGKIAGMFATGGGFGGAGGGVELTLAGLCANFLEHGMIVVGFPKHLNGYADAGLQWGPYARTGNHEGMPEGIREAQLAAARAYGAHLIETAARLLRD